MAAMTRTFTLTISGDPAELEQITELDIEAVLNDSNHFMGISTMFEAQAESTTIQEEPSGIVPVPQPDHPVDQHIRETLERKGAALRD